MLEQLGDLLADGGIVYNPGGGTHHGRPDHAAGFCYLNDPVLAIKALQARGLRRIAYVDIDAHHCDGVEAAFHGAESVLMISTHEEGRWPFTGALEEMILPMVAAHRPEALVLQCGADAVAEDPLARLALSNNSHWRAVAALKTMAPRLLVLGGGGYNPWTVGRLWSGVWATLNGHEIPGRLPGAGRSVLAGLSWSRRKGDRPEHLVETLRDPPREGPVAPEVRTRVAALRARGRVWA